MNTKHIRAFGWVVHNLFMPAGSSARIDIPKEIHKSEAVNQALCVRGLTTCTVSNCDNPLFTYMNHKPGTFSKEDLPEILSACTVNVKVEEDLEWWCVMDSHNDNKHALVDKVALAAGESLAMPIGTKILVCEGDGVVNETISVSKASTINVQNVDSTLTATTQLYGLKFAHLRSEVPSGAPVGSDIPLTWSPQ
jgi:hypothetical protein